MNTLAGCLVVIGALAAATSFAACSGSPSHADSASSAQSQPESSSAAASEEPAVSLVSATAVVNACPDAKRMNTRAAQLAIHKLVDPCAGVPGGKASFMAKLLPGGAIELASPEGDPQEGLVPTCVLKNKLRHHVLLRKPCTFNVVLEERPVPAPVPSASSSN